MIGEDRPVPKRMISMHRFAAVSLLAVVAALSACGKNDAKAPASPASAASSTTTELAKPDPRNADQFTYANYQDVVVTHLDLDLAVDFAARALDGVATMDVKRLNPAAKSLALDTNDLSIAKVETRAKGVWSPASYALSGDDPALGSKLEIDLSEEADAVRIAYRTAPGAEGLQWLEPAQTAGRKHPFLYTQNQSIFARTMAPVQDTPAVRMTYSAHVKTPKDLFAVMSAAQDKDGVRDGDYRFDMPQPVPAYLLALAVGDIGFKPISETIGVYAEPSLLDAAAAEFADAPAFERIASSFYGPYRWGRYDMLVLPPSYPFGGMENPRLTFLTPTVIAGDRSLVNVVAHEIAHSWSGNLVTNATWRDAWLNEGFTSYVENRIIEAHFGRERALMEQALQLADTKRDIEGAERPALTRLDLPADLAHPDDAFSQVAYGKGQFFLTFLEQRYGRPAFDAFLKSYFEHFAFRALRTADFRAYLDENLVQKFPGKTTKAEIDAWIDGDGLPATTPIPASDAFARVDAAQKAWLSGARLEDAVRPSAWTAQEWVRFIETLPAETTKAQLAALDGAFGLSSRSNAEIASVWYLKSIKAGYAGADKAMEAFVTRVGRGKYIYKIYAALKESGRKDDAARIFAAAKPGYHPIAQRRVEDILAK
jgi:aminopeptidase N